MLKALYFTKTLLDYKYLIIHNNTCWLIAKNISNSKQTPEDNNPRNNADNTKASHNIDFVDLPEGLQQNLKEIKPMDWRQYKYNLIFDLSIQSEVRLVWPEVINSLPDKFKYAENWLKRAQLEIDKDKLYIKLESKLACKRLDCDRVLTLLTNRLHKFIAAEITLQFVNGDFYCKKQKKNSQKEQSKSSSSVKTSKNNNNRRVRARKKKKRKKRLVYGQVIPDSKNPYELDNIPEDGKAVVRGEVFNVDQRRLKNGRLLKLIAITDQSDSLLLKVFCQSEADFTCQLEEGDRVKARGQLKYDRYSRETVMLVDDLMLLPAQQREDRAESKRVELHLHTKMSDMDAVIDVEEAVKRAADWGHNSIAITDHGSVQAFPDAYQAGKEHGVKIIYGLEAYLVDDGDSIVVSPGKRSLKESEYVVFDFETTGLEASQERIIEIGAVKIADNEIIDRFSTLVNPQKSISRKITKLTGIKNNDVSNAPAIEEVLPEFLDFIGDAVLVAHNIDFDYSFLRAECHRSKLEVPRLPLLDTVALSRALLTDLNSHKLNKVAKELEISLENHHRALDDAAATAQILLELIEKAQQGEGYQQLAELNKLTGRIDWKKKRYSHAVLLAKNKTGLKDLYYLISRSHLNNFYQKPRILKSELEKHRANLLIGSACEAGELFQAIMKNKSQGEIKNTAKFYDYLEIQPVKNNEFLIPESFSSLQEIKELNRQIYQLGKKLNKPVVATSDAHFLNPEDYIYREILQTGQKFPDADQQPPLYFRTTDEMLAEFSYLGEEAAEEVVITNPGKIDEEIAEIPPMPSGLFTPDIDGAEDKIREMSFARAKELYGNELPEIVKDRLEKELEAIISNGYAVIYLISHKLVKQSLENGYLVGSRGSVGSSLVAYMCEITEVNPLPPHYRCPDEDCNHYEFFTGEQLSAEEDSSAGTGADLPDRPCPNCETGLIKDGFAIPFEVFMGFDGNKVPDIDLNFSGEYQSKIHHITEEYFGRDYVFRAGTISTIADRTAYGFVKNYLQEKDIDKRNTEINRLVQGCTGVKRTTGQHPGGLMVVPQDMDIHDFTPVQYPANDQSSDVRTTHFDYHAISGRILKLDLLGHDDPTSIRMLQDMTGVDPLAIKLDDPETMKLFSGVSPLELDRNDLDLKVGTLGIPEFGTSFVRQMLVDTRPTTFAELVRISGLSHGTDVWLNNARDLIQEGIAELKEVISVRDDIMNYLIQQGIEPEKSFTIMEHVRKGKGLTSEEEKIMKEAKVPEWYIESCKKIKYMFPKAHAAAYVMMAFRIAYFKVNYPAEFYTTYFSIKADDFDAAIISQGYDYVLDYHQELKSQESDLTAKDKGLLTVLEIVLEAMDRGIEFLPVDLYHSQISTFQLTEKGLLPPLISLTGLGNAAAESLVAARKECEFSSIEDLQNRTSLSSTVVEVMKDHGSLAGLPEKDQLSLFGE